MDGVRSLWPTAAIVAAVAAAAIVVVLILIAVSTSSGGGAATDPPHPSSSSTPAASETPTTTATIKGTIVALPTSGKDATFHLAVDGHGVLPIHIPAHLEPVTDAPVTVTLTVPHTVVVEGANGDRFRALETYVTSQRGIVLEVESITK